MLSCCMCSPSPGFSCIPLSMLFQSGAVCTTPTTTGQQRDVLWLSPDISLQRCSPVQWWTRPLKNLQGTCFVLWPLPSRCPRAAQSLVHVPHLETQCFNHSLNHCPFLGSYSLALEKKAIVLTKWLSDTTASHLI